MRKPIISLMLCVTFLAVTFMSCNQGTKGRTPVPNPGQGNTNEPGNNNAPALQHFDATVAVDNLKALNGTYTITPKDPDKTYAFGVMTKVRYEAEKAKGDKKDPPEGIFSFDKAWYAYLGSLSQQTWKEAAKKNGYYVSGLSSGVLLREGEQGHISPLYMKPGTECVIYYYQISETADAPESEIYEFPFTTANVERITLGKDDIKIETSNAFWKKSDDCGVDVKVTLTGAAEGKSYVVYVTPDRRFYQWYVHNVAKGWIEPATGKAITMDDAVYKCITSSVESRKPLPFYIGNQDKIEIKNHNFPDDPDKAPERYVLLALYDEENGVLADPVWHKFTVRQ